jgi:hypothetical protein
LCQIRPILGRFLWQFGGWFGCDRGKIGNRGAAAKIAKSHTFLPQRHKEIREKHLFLARGLDAENSANSLESLSRRSGGGGGQKTAAAMAAMPKP